MSNTHTPAQRLLAAVLAATLALPLTACAQSQPAATTSAATTSAATTATTTATTTTSAPAPTAEITDVTTIAYLGPAGTYTEEATKLFFGSNDELQPQKTVAEALALVADGQAAYAVIPQENTLGGPTIDYIDALLATKGVSVVGEVILPIRQTLMALPGTDLSQVKTIYSHKQGLLQSAAWLDEHLPNAERVEKSSTAAAAQEVSESGDQTVAAIAAPGAAELYQLEVLQANVSQSEANKTRFYVVARDANKLEGYGRALFVVDATAEQLPALLNEACTGDTKLVCVHDRPDGTQLGSYHFVVELACDKGFADAELARLQGIDGFWFLGRYACIEG